MPTIDLSIEGMSCGHCVSSVRRALQSIPGISVTDVRIGSASVETDEAPGPIDAINGAIEDAGFVAAVANR